MAVRLHSYCTLLALRKRACRSHAESFWLRLLRSETLGITDVVGLVHITTAHSRPFTPWLPSGHTTVPMSSVLNGRSSLRIYR